MVDNQQQGSDYNSRIVVQNRAPDPELTKWQLSNANEIIMLEEDLRGERYNPTDPEHPWIKIEGAVPVMNEMGIFRVIAWVRNHSGKNTVISDYSDQDIVYERQDLNSVFNDMLWDNFELFEIDEGAYASINKQVDSIIFASLKRAHNAGEAKRASERTSEAYGMNQQSKPQSRLKLW